MAAGRSACEGWGEGSAAGDGGRRLAAPLLGLLSALPCPALPCIAPGLKGQLVREDGNKAFFYSRYLFLFHVSVGAGRWVGGRPTGVVSGEVSPGAHGEVLQWQGGESAL